MINHCVGAFVSRTGRAHITVMGLGLWEWPTIFQVRPQIEMGNRKLPLNVLVQ